MVKVTDERLGQLSESQISQPILLPDELSEILANLSVSPDTALRHIDALMGAEFTDMLVHEGEKGGLCLDAALQSLLDILSLEVRSLFHKHIESLWMESNNCSMSLLVSTASLLLPSNRLARGFQSDGVQDNLQENCAIVLFTVMRPMMGAFPFLSIPLFLGRATP